MKPFNYLLRSFVALSLVAMVACVDENFKVKDTSLEVTVGEGELIGCNNAVGIAIYNNLVALRLVCRHAKGNNKRHGA